MINELLSRPNIQEFLNKYPSSRWKELITDLFEIGILNLRNSYNRDEFSRNEFYALIHDLEHPIPSRIQTPNQNYSYNNQYQRSNYSYPRYSSNYNYNTPNNINQKYLKENISNYNNNFNYERRWRRLEKQQLRATPSQMDAFYSEKNEFPLKTKVKKKRSHREIMDKIFKSQQNRENMRFQIREQKAYDMNKRRMELQEKRMEKMMERQAEEDIKEEERQKRRRKEEEDYLEGYGEDHQEEDEVEEDEGTDKYNDYNRGYDDDDEEEEDEGEEEHMGEGEAEGEEEVGEEEEGEEEQMGEGEGEEGGEEEQMQEN